MPRRSVQRLTAWQVANTATGSGGVGVLYVTAGGMGGEGAAAGAPRELEEALDLPNVEGCMVCCRMQHAKALEGEENQGRPRLLAVAATRQRANRGQVNAGSSGAAFLHCLGLRSGWGGDCILL